MFPNATLSCRPVTRKKEYHATATFASIHKQRWVFVYKRKKTERVGICVCKNPSCHKSWTRISCTWMPLENFQKSVVRGTLATIWILPCPTWYLLCILLSAYSKIGNLNPQYVTFTRRKAEEYSQRLHTNTQTIKIWRIFV